MYYVVCILHFVFFILSSVVCILYFVVYVVNFISEFQEPPSACYCNGLAPIETIMYRVVSIKDP
jgi:hypothetical protein